MSEGRTGERRARSRPEALRLLALLGAAAASAATVYPQATEANGPTISIPRISGEIRVDGDLSDAAWQGVPPIDTWWETNPGDNLESNLRNVARMAYDDEFLYAAFEFDDPEPAKIRAPLGDRDQLGSQTDYGGILLDARNDGKSAQMFLANASGILYDAITNDATGEDSSPDFFWESVGRITESGYQMEMRIPFSSIRYSDSNPEQWGLLLYRNRPRDFRYQYFTSKLPRDRNCFICNVRPLTGLADLPSGRHWVAAPYATASFREQPVDGLGSELGDSESELSGGIDLKFVPNPDTVIDATIHPDFSQIESDTAQITANERFAIFQAERRPFFLESVDLFSTPFTAVYTRTFTDPKWGARITGDVGKTKYTALVGEDDGGGLVILPGPNGSGFAEQDFDSFVAFGRARRDFGSSFVSFLYSGREIDGGGSNHVIGPDFSWRPNDKTTVTGQLLWSVTETPERTDLADEWDGRELEGHAADLWWNWSDGKWDYFAEGIDVADDFRAFNGFITQVGHQTANAEVGRTFRSEDGAIRRLRLFGFGRYSTDRDGNLLEKRIVPGFGMDALWNSFVRVEFGFEELRAVTRTFERFQIRPTIEVKPGKIVTRIYLEGRIGDEIDFANDRKGEGVTYTLTGEITPTPHLRLTPTYSHRWLDVETADGRSGRLFTAQVARLRALYTFNAKSWLRLIGQWVETENRPELWTFEVERRQADLATSLVFAYKLNWQTVLYLGVGDSQALDEREELQPADRQAFFKVSYAFRG